MVVKNIILGTAGHIDHGKTSFIKALTGIDCDRLKEEKERGITIELGYASFKLPSGINVGIVDVPGHEKFVSKMVAGAAGVDVVALIIAADEGIKPQTKEHLYICEILEVKKGIVVLTKVDLADEELIQLQKEDIRDFLKGTFLENAPIVEVSSITGKGIPEFISELDEIAKTVTQKPLSAPFRLPIDDVISIKGFGTVIRGTAIAGKIKTGEEVILLPDGKKSRVRGIQNHGKFVEEGIAGQRLAINLPDLERNNIARGMIVTKDGYFLLSDKILVDFHYLPYNQKPLKPKITCQFHVMTMKTTAKVIFMEVEKVFPGDRVFAMVKTDKPYAFSYGDNYVIRGFGIYTTMGGGKIIHPSLKTFNKKVINEDYLKILSSGTIHDVVDLFIFESKEKGITVQGLMGLTNKSYDEITNILDSLKEQGVIKEDTKAKKYYHKNIIDRLKKNIINELEKFHKDNPLKTGINKEELMMRTGGHTELFQILLKELINDKYILSDEDILKLPGFIQDNLEELFQSIEKILKSQHLQTEEPSKIAIKLNMEEKKLRDLFFTLTKKGRLLKVKDDYYLHVEVFEDFKRKVLEFFSKKAILTPQDIRDMFNLSRKYTIPLLEFMDSLKITIRVPEGRKLRK